MLKRITLSFVISFRLARHKKTVVIIVKDFLFASFSLLTSVIFVEKANNGKDALSSFPSIKAYRSIESFTACFELWHQIEIRVCRPVSKELMLV